AGAAFPPLLPEPSTALGTASSSLLSETGSPTGLVGHGSERNAAGSVVADEAAGERPQHAHGDGRLVERQRVEVLAADRPTRHVGVHPHPCGTGCVDPASSRAARSWRRVATPDMAVSTPCRAVRRVAGRTDFSPTHSPGPGTTRSSPGTSTRPVPSSTMNTRVPAWPRSMRT